MKEPIYMPDNSTKALPISDETVLAWLKAFSGKSISTIKTENLLYVGSEIKQKDRSESRPIFTCTRSDNEIKVKTYNILGYLGQGDVQLYIHSRFAKEHSKDFFLRYMLDKVFAPNILDIFDTRSQAHELWDFRYYFLPIYLEKALNQGIYQPYQQRQYNDARFRGQVSIPRHLRFNEPFRGNIAYETRERSADTPILQLVRHAIEFIQAKPYGQTFMNARPDFAQNCQIVRELTPSYQHNQRLKCLKDNLKPFSHPYFSEYRPLQMLCLQILHEEHLNFGADDERLSGLLFDAAWLWERYLGTLMPKKIKATDNTSRKGGQKIYVDAKTQANRVYFPDFFCSQKLVIDAKYKNFDSLEVSEISREDTYQMLSYMFLLKAKQGVFLYPTVEGKSIESRALEGALGTIHKIGLKIPQDSADYSAFRDSIKESERQVVEELEKLMG